MTITPAALIAARNSRATIITSFLKCISAYPDETIWVLEGKDIKYYSPRIEILLGFRPRGVLAAGGKRKVLDLLNYVESNHDFDDRRIAFLVDRDFDEIHPDSPKLYVTPTYSVENFYATEQCLERVLQGQFDCNDHKSEKEIQSICKRYKLWLRQFVEKSRDLNAWIKIQKSLPGYKLRLNDVPFSKLFDIQWNDRRFSIKKKYTISSLTNIFPDSAPIKKADVQAEAVTTFSADLVKIIRGKYLAEFVFAIITKLIQDARQKIPLFFKKKRTVTFSISKTNFLSDMSQYSDTPACIRSFILSFA